MNYSWKDKEQFSKEYHMVCKWGNKLPKLKICIVPEKCTFNAIKLYVMQGWAHSKNLRESVG